MENYLHSLTIALVTVSPAVTFSAASEKLGNPFLGHRKSLLMQLIILSPSESLTGDCERKTIPFLRVCIS